MKAIKLFIALLFVGSISIFTKSYGQLAIKKDVIDSGGAVSESGSLHTIYTIGEVAVNEQGTGSLAISEGFISPQLFANIGISDYELLNTVTIFPNPATDYIQFHFSDTREYQIAVYSLDGKRLISKTIQDSPDFSLDIRQFVKATYVLLIIDRKNKKYQSFKLIKD